MELFGDPWRKSCEVLTDIRERHLGYRLRVLRNCSILDWRSSACLSESANTRASNQAVSTAYHPFVRFNASDCHASCVEHTVEEAFLWSS